MSTFDQALRRVVRAARRAERHRVARWLARAGELRAARLVEAMDRP